MKFERQRTLKNNIYTTKFIRVEDECEDSVIKEQILEDDFGHVEVQVGGTFVAAIYKNESQVFEVTTDTKKSLTKQSKEPNFKFSLPAKKVKLVMGVEIPFACDATKECDRTFEDSVLPAKKAAEFKCKIFEEIITKRIAEAVKAWEEQFTDFEKEELDPIHFDLNKDE